jgi:hypothetical protein
MSVARIVKSAPEPLLSGAPPFAEVPTRLYDEGELQNYFDEELSSAKGERNDFEAQVARWIKAYGARFDNVPKDFPFEGAANMTVPVIKQIVNTLASSYMQTLLIPRPRWFFKDLMEQWDPFVPILEDFLDLSAERDMKFESKVRPWIIECCKLGTSVAEIPWQYTEKDVPRHMSVDTVVFKNVVIADGPAIWRVPLLDFLIRFAEQDEQEAEWVAKRFRLNERQMMLKYAQGKFREGTRERVLGRGEDHPDVDEALEAQEEVEGTQPTERNQWEVFQGWVSWQLKGQSAKTDLLVDYHQRSNTILGVRFNPYWHMQRPFVPIRYFIREDRFYGEGLCEQLEALQAERSTIRNQRLDNATLANTRMWRRDPMVRGFKPGDKIYAGRVITARAGEVDTIQMGDVYPSTILNEQVSQQDAEQLSGANEAQFGSLPVTRTTFGAQSQLLSEQAKRFDQTISEMRRGIGRIGHLSLSMYFQFGAGDKGRRWMGDRGRIVAAILKLPMRASELGLGIEASAPTSRLNKEARQQASIQMFNLMVNLYERLLPLVAQIAPEAIPPVARELVVSAKKFMFDVLEDFNLTNPEDVLRGLTFLEKVLPAAEDLGGLESFERAERDAEVMGRLEGLADLLRETPRNGAGLTSIPARSGLPQRLPREEGVLPGSATSTEPTSGSTF